MIYVRMRRVESEQTLIVKPLIKCFPPVTAFGYHTALFVIKLR